MRVKIVRYVVDNGVVRVVRKFLGYLEYKVVELMVWSMRDIYIK